MYFLSRHGGEMVSRWAHNPKVRGSKPRYALFFLKKEDYPDQDSNLNLL